MVLEFGYGTGVERVEVPEENLLAVLCANEMDHPIRGREAVIHALEHPIGAPMLTEVVRPGQKVAIITSDISRPMPSYEVLPPVLEQLNRGGIPDEDITVVLALGSHRGHTREEMIHLVGEEVFSRVKCVDSDPTDCVRMGVTDKGTPVDITRVVAQDRKSVV